MHFDGLEAFAIAYEVAQETFFGFTEAQRCPLCPMLVQLLIRQGIVVGAIAFAEGSVFGSVL